MKNQVSKRITTSAGVIQRDQWTTGWPAGRRTPASSSSSRTAAAAWSASSEWTAPPGNTQAPPMKRCSGFRCTSSTSGPSAVSRRTTIDAAWRGSVTSPSIPLLARMRAYPPALGQVNRTAAHPAEPGASARR